MQINTRRLLFSTKTYNYGYGGFKTTEITELFADRAE